MDTQQRLREKALDCRRLARLSADDRVTKALLAKARECEGAADLIADLSRSAEPTPKSHRQ